MLYFAKILCCFAIRNMGISCTLVHHMLLHCGTAVWSKQASRPNQCLVCDANKCMGPPDNAVDCDMIDVQNQSGTFSAKFYKKFMQLLVVFLLLFSIEPSYNCHKDE